MHPDGFDSRQTTRLRLKDLPLEARPRERLAAVGAAALSDAELLAILLGSGSRSESAISLAERILVAFGAPGALANARPEELAQLPGVGTAKATRLLAACEVGRRLLGAHPGVRPTITSPQDLVGLVQARLGWETKEHVVGVWLDARHHVLGQEAIAIGHLTEAALHPRELFRAAIRRGAAAVAVVHNHPSGDPSPSLSDRALTRRLIAVGDLVGIPLLDHVIVASGGHFSFRDEPDLWLVPRPEPAP